MKNNTLQKKCKNNYRSCNAAVSMQTAQECCNVLLTPGINPIAVNEIYLSNI